MHLNLLKAFFSSLGYSKNSLQETHELMPRNSGDEYINKNDLPNTEEKKMFVLGTF
ncbi:MAG: hypothetical protein H6622_09665 [Halobacteriovoraceae bacterium]|nr:hypothetical protein [Halobacteriovoraceae bacterium]